MTTFSNLSDTEMIALMKADDELAFAELYKRYWKKLYQIAYNIIQQEQVAQDIVQEVFISFWNRRKETEILQPAAYLAQATRFSVLKAIRAQKTDEQFYQRLRNVTTDMIVEEPLLFKEQQEVLGALINSLPEDCKETFRLSREDQLTYKEIAAKLNISEKTVEKRMTKSLKYLRENLRLELCIAVLILGGYIR